MDLVPLQAIAVSLLQGEDVCACERRAHSDVSQLEASRSEGLAPGRRFRSELCSTARAGVKHMDGRDAFLHQIQGAVGGDRHPQASRRCRRGVSALICLVAKASSLFEATR